MNIGQILDISEINTFRRAGTLNPNTKQNKLKTSRAVFFSSKECWSLYKSVIAETDNTMVLSVSGYRDQQRLILSVLD